MITKMRLRDWREAVRSDERLQPTSKLIGYTLSTYAEHDGKTAAPGYEQIAEDTCKSVRTVGRAIRELRAAGYLLEERKGHSSGRGYSFGYSTIHMLAMP